MIKILYSGDEIADRCWDELAGSSSTASWFQTREAYHFFQSISFLEAFAFGIERDGVLKGVVVGYIQKDGGAVKRFFSRRAIINGGPLLADDITEEELSALLGALKEKLQKKVIYIETRNYADYSRFRAVFEADGFVYEPHYDFLVDVTGGDAWEKRMESSRMRFVKSSLKNGASLVDAPTEADIKGYYAVLQALYSSKIKRPLFPLDFFMNLYHSPFCRFLLVKYQDEIVGGTVCVFDEKAAYEWYVCGKDGVYKKIYPSTVATYSAIRFAASHGCRYFDMMGAGAPGDGGYGVREFKAKFGGELQENGRFSYVCNKLMYAVGKLGVKVLKRL